MAAKKGFNNRTKAMALRVKRSIEKSFCNVNMHIGELRKRPSSKFCAN